MRGKSVSALIEYNHEKRKAAETASFEKNQATALVDVYKSALQVLTKEAAVPRGTQPPQRAPRSSEVMRQGGTEPASVYTEPDRFVDATVDVARQAIVPEIKRDLDAVNQELAALRQQGLERSIREAFVTARPDGIPKGDWDADAPVMSAYIVANNRNVTDPQSYAEAAKWLDGFRARKTSTPAPAAATPVAPAAPAPPVGNGRAPAPVTKGQPKVSGHMRAAWNDVYEVMGNTLKQVGAPPPTMDSILDDMRQDPSLRGLFE